MNRFKRFIANTFFKELLPAAPVSRDASSGGQRELASEFIKQIVYKTSDDNDFEEPDFDMEDIENAYDTDSYVRQGVDKYVDQIFKEGYSFYGKDTNTVDYLKLRLEYIAEATSTPTNQFLIDIAEDLVKYGNCMIVKSRSNDVNLLPESTNIQGLAGKDPVVGYFCANPSTMTVMRDEHGVVTKWKQETDAGEQEFNPEDVIHFYYKRPKGNAYGTSFLVPVLDDIRALRQAEENVLKMMYRNIYPFNHVKVGTEDQPGTENEVDKIIEAINNMDVEGGLVTTERVTITPIASDKVIDAEPYLRYMEQRVFSGMGIPDILWGRGNCYDEETQTLTDNGWKYWYEINTEDKIGTYNPDTGNIEYHKPNDHLLKYVSHYVGDMVHFKSKHIDIKVSPQHDMWVCTNGRTKGKMKWKKMKAIDLYNSGIKNFYFMEQTNGIEDFIDEEFIEIPYIKSRCTNGNNNIIKFNKSDFYEFLGYFISEGCLNSTKTNKDGIQKKFHISLSQQKIESLNKMIACVEKLGLQYSIRTDKRDNTNEISIYHKSLWIWLKENIGIYCHEKHIPNFIKNSSKNNLEILLNALIDGDGTIDKRTGRTSKSYYSTSIKLVDDVLEICVKLGYKAKISYGKHHINENHLPVHRVLISNSCSNYRYMSHDNISIEQYDGIMYCYNVPNHLFITRRNGKVAIQGNTANRSTGDNMTSEMADRIRAITKIIEMFFNSFIVKELLMEGGYDPVLNPDQVAELKFHDNDVDVKIKKEVHAIYKYEHNAITEDEMRDLLGMDPIADGEREKLFVELITRETLRIQSELSTTQQTSNSSTGNKETNNKEKNSGGQTSKKSSSSGKDNYNAIIGLVKDSVNKMNDEMDKYVINCYTNKQQILQSNVDNIVAKHIKDVSYIMKAKIVDKTLINVIDKMLIENSVKLCNNIHDDLIGTNVYSTSKGSVNDMITIRINLFGDTITNYLRYKIDATKFIDCS